MKKKKSRKYLYLIGIVLLIIILIIFISKNRVRNSKNGNNMNSQEIVDCILNVKSYKAQVTVQVNSNKNNNKYILKQEYNTENGCIQEVVEPANIAGVKITSKDGNLIVENAGLDLSTMFTSYKGLGSNELDLSEFIQDYNSNTESNFDENNSGNEIIMRTSGKTKFTKSKTLYINREKIIPTKLVIKDDNQNTTIIIEYNDIELN